MFVISKHIKHSNNVKQILHTHILNGFSVKYANVCLLKIIYNNIKIQISHTL